MNNFTTFLLKRLRWTIGGIGLILFAVLWFAADRSDPTTATGGLLINLAASALTVAFTALLIDWLYERRQRVLVARPLEFAKHELASVIFMIGLILGKPYLQGKFNNITNNWLKIKESTMDHLAVLRKDFINALGELTTDNCPPTSAQLAVDLSRQLGEQVTRIDEILRLYGFALEAELRDGVHLLRDRIVSLRNSLDTFSMGGGMEREPALHKLVVLGVTGLVEAIKATDAEWGQVKK